MASAEEIKIGNEMCIKYIQSRIVSNDTMSKNYMINTWQEYGWSLESIIQYPPQMDTIKITFSRVEKRDKDCPLSPDEIVKAERAKRDAEFALKLERNKDSSKCFIM